MESDTVPPVFRHDALLYSSTDEYLHGIVPFVRDGLTAEQRVLVVLPPDRLAVVADALGADRDRVTFADMTAVGRNPARIIPAWTEFAGAGGGAVRGVGEPVWAARSSAELAEAQLNEALLNRVFAGRPGFWLRCPYDVRILPPEVITAVQHTHPGPVYVPTVTKAGSLPEPPECAARLEYDADTLSTVRQAVRGQGELGGLDGIRVRQLVLAVHEAAANSIRHGGGRGVLRIWREHEVLVCEIRDGGEIRDPLVGRVRPHPKAGGGRGMWIINQLCDLVQVRSSAAGTVVRMHQRLA